MRTQKQLAPSLIWAHIIDMDDTTPKRGGAGRGQGRKPLQPGQETVTVTIRMTQPQKDKLARLGGPLWVRAKVDKAPEPKD